jgi:hypothetical protein
MTPRRANALARRYLDPLGSSGPEILQTVRAYFDHQANIEQAADALHVHPNTVRYRLKRLEELSGARLRDPLTALEVWWAVATAIAGRGPLTRGPVRQAASVTPSPMPTRPGCTTAAAIPIGSALRGVDVAAVGRQDV